MSREETAWRVERVSGLLWPGFTKQLRSSSGTTFLWGIAIGRFDVVQVGDTRELRYRRWPIVDVLEAPPSGSDPIAAAGYVCLPGGGRRRFCRFTLRPDRTSPPSD
jgi:hypothetical protein